MDKQNTKKESWESLSSVISGIDTSVSQDSCYSSDEVSVTSTVSPVAGSSGVSSFVSAAASSLPPFLHSVLKKPYAVDEEDSESESGYGSDGFENESDISIVDADAFSEEGDDDLFYVPKWDETSRRDETNADVDDSFIGFESVVRFDSDVQYIETPEFEEETDATTTTPKETEMTVHEMMEIARKSGNIRVIGKESSDSHDDDDHSDTESDDDRMDKAEEHTRDAVDVELDKRLFAAYMNGMNGITDRCRGHLRRHVKDSRSGRLESPFLDSDDSSSGVYLDQVLHHVIGVFPNVVIKEELDELARLRDEKVKLGGQADSSREAVQKSTETLLGKIEWLLVERLAKGTVEVGRDEMNFLAVGIAYALERWSLQAHK